MPALLRLAIISAFCSAVSGTAPAAEWTTADLMHALAGVPTREATYTEVKSLSILQAPLRSSGVLRYRAPDFVQKQTLEPQPETFEIDAGRLVVETPGDGRRELELDRMPALRALSEAIRATLAGDLAALQTYYVVDSSGQPDGWTLRLRPRDEETARYLDGVTVGGRRDQVLSIETVESDGDRSTMTISPLD